MFVERLNTLTKAYRAAKKTNEAYDAAYKNVAKFTQELGYMSGLMSGLNLIGGIIVDQEEKWQSNVLRLLEAEITEYLSFVYPSDGYTITLSSRILRGKVRIDGEVRSYFVNGMSGEVSDTQGRLFQQIVSFAALATIQGILGVKTIYVDEAFSGASKANIEKVNTLLKHVHEKGFNVVLIAQDTNIAQGIDANILYLSRSIDNKTSIEQRVVLK